MSARADRQPILSNAVASGSNGRGASLSVICWFASSAEFPNMAQRAVMQYLSLDDWKIAARLPIPAGELMLSRIRNYGWIEIRVEKQHTAIKLTPAGLKAMRSAI